MRILIADDDVTSRLILAGVLAKHGHEVVATVDGTEAWEAMRRPGAPALAILDWMMPGLSGVEVCRLIRGRQTDQPPYLLLLTSRARRPTSSRASRPAPTTTSRSRSIRVSCAPGSRWAAG